ncbi:hypothetical protein DLAC_07070 [Tieghemostelium lacteum]|uniref:Uncharacterized protein n=1 Tax=Tieghemostelium lacteum TaxID=361077 RepID=A0A151ZE38_TIELA|nr:hypothetical protein DLAC_07070 [Tieghemostelium lacteum]|eukprot:KYQ92223.1 hypothetical protein DLAC_07070 [Tieghemostelium lacteum]
MNITQNDQYWIQVYKEIIQESNENLKQIVNQPDFMKKSVQEQLSDTLFDRFYDQAKIYASTVPDSDTIHEMYTSLQMETILSIKWFINTIVNIDYIKNANNTEDSVFRKFMEQYRKIITILLTKPKFTRLLKCDIEQRDNFIKGQVNQTLVLLQGHLQKNISSGQKKGEILNSLQSSAQFIDYFIKNSIIQELDIARYFQINVQPLIVFGCSIDNSQIFRGMSFQILELLPSTQYKSTILKCLAQVANDQYALDFYWRFGGIYDSAPLTVLFQRIPMSASIELSRNILVTLSHALKSKIILLGSANGNTGLYIKVIFQFIDYFIQKKSLNPDIQDNESLSVPYEIMELLSEMIKQVPDRMEVLNRLLDYGTNESSLAVLINNSNRFTKSTWINVLLPFLKTRIEAMKLQGVSGIQSEQSVIECVRECSRLFYLDSTRDMSYQDNNELGHRLLMTIVEAIRHGYFETERFSVVCSIIIINHLPASLEWFQDIINPQTCNSHKTSRGIFEVFLQLLGFTEVEESITLQTLKTENIGKVIHQIIQIKNHIAFSLMSTCLKFKSGKRFLSDNPYFVNILIQSIKDVILESLNKEQYLSIDQSESVTELIKNLTSVVHPFDSPMLFNLALQTLSMVPPSFSSAFGDESLSHMIDKVSENVPLCMSDIELGLKLGGAETRYSLCSFVPQFCIKDDDPYIRCQALRALEKREDLVALVYKDIISSCDIPNNSIYELEIMISASPLMPMIASIERSLTSDCLYILYKAIRLSSLSDPQNKPDARPILYLNQIMDDLSPNELVTHLKNSNLLSIIVKLKKYSVKLKQSLKELSRKGFIQKTKNKTYNYLYNESAQTKNQLAANLLFDQSKMLENTDLYRSIAILIKISHEYNDFFGSVVVPYLKDNLLKRIVSTHFHEIEPKQVNESHLGAVQRQQKLYRELLLLLQDKPTLQQYRDQIESALSLNKYTVIVDYFLDQKLDPTSARKWLKDNQIRDQLLYITIEKYENNILNTSYLSIQSRDDSNHQKYLIKPNLYSETYSILLKQQQQQQQQQQQTISNTDSNPFTNYQQPSMNGKPVEYEMKNLNLDENQLQHMDEFDDIETYNPVREESNWKRILSFQDKQTVEMTPLLSNSGGSSKKTKKLVSA